MTQSLWTVIQLCPGTLKSHKLCQGVLLVSDLEKPTCAQRCTHRCSFINKHLLYTYYMFRTVSKMCLNPFLHTAYLLLGERQVMVNQSISKHRRCQMVISAVEESEMR
jgi:hypothetical protein